MRLRVMYSLRRPCGMPVKPEIWPCVTPCAPRTAMTVPRSRLRHASRTSVRAQTFVTVARTSETLNTMARYPFPWSLACGISCG